MRSGLYSALLIACIAVSISAASAQQSERSAEFAAPATRFAAIDVVIDSDEPIAAWQFELTETGGAMRVVGVENGDSAAFADAPWFDLDAVSSGRADRIIVADFNADPQAALPSGLTRVATIHVQLSTLQTPDYAVRLMAAGNRAGDAIDARISVVPR